jgi:Prealbumin-like fold domain
VNSGSSPNKDDLKRIYLASKTLTGGTRAGHVILNLAWVRIPQNTVNASAHVGFEFNQGKTPCGSGSDGLVQRTAGDMLIVYDFEGSSSGDATITVRRWVTSGACEVSNKTAPCWGTAQDLTSAGFAESKVNVTGPVCDALPPGSNNCTAPNPTEQLGNAEFGEAGIDLTAAGIFQPNVCAAFGQVEGVSRSSGNSGNAAMEDLVGPGHIDLTNCGEVIIVKHTDPSGIDQNFDYTSTLAGGQISCTTDSTPAAFTLNAATNTTEDCKNVPFNSYTVLETLAANFELESLTCTTGGSQDGTNPLQADITLTQANSPITCTYVNRQLLGAIKVTKTYKHIASGTGDHPQAGVDFTVNGVTKTTDANGEACFDGLPFATYAVHETVPTGYHVDGNDKQVTVDNTASCSAATYAGETVSFHNTPLTDLTITATSEVSGGTQSSIRCTTGAHGGFPGTDIGNSPVGPTDPANVTANGLEPGTYTCEVVIDP